MLENKRIGFIGAGMMAEAITTGLLKAGVPRDNIRVSDPDEHRRRIFEEQLGVAAFPENMLLAEFANVVILSVKPDMISKVLEDIKATMIPEQLLISIAAGVTTATIETMLGKEVPVIRVMPNTPCLIGCGASALASGKHAGASDMETAQQIFEAVGKVVQVTEDKMDAVTGLSGSGPAYIYMLIEALADGGVRMGLPKGTALTLAAQTVAGSAMMVLNSGEHPAILRDRVMTPGGTTIAGVAVLEDYEFRAALIEAVTAATRRSVELGKKSSSD